MNEERASPFEKKSASGSTIILIALGVLILGAVGYDIYGRTTPPPAPVVQQTGPAPAELQVQLQQAQNLAAQSEQKAQQSEMDGVMWVTVAKAAAGIVGTKPPTLISLQRAIASSGDPDTRRFLREYFKNPANLEKVTDVVVFVARMTTPGPMTMNFIKSCEPLFTAPLPDMAPANPDALWCYEFLKRRQAEGGDIAAWQKLLGAASAEMIGKKT
jgi:hypothetical protein